MKTNLDSSLLFLQSVSQFYKSSISLLDISFII